MFRYIRLNNKDYEYQLINAITIHFKESKTLNTVYCL